MDYYKTLYENRLILGAVVIVVGIIFVRFVTSLRLRSDLYTPDSYATEPFVGSKAGSLDSIRSVVTEGTKKIQDEELIIATHKDIIAGTIDDLHENISLAMAREIVKYADITAVDAVSANSIIAMDNVNRMKSFLDAIVVSKEAIDQV
jgi:hypothetical protein